MDYFLKNRIADFLKPYGDIIHKVWLNLEVDYLEKENKGYIGYKGNAYRRAGTFIYSDIVNPNTIYYFEDEIPQYVMDYVGSVDRYQEARLAIEAILRKVTNHYGGQEAYSVSHIIADLPSGSTNYTHLKDILADLRENNIEQLEAIKKINIDRLLLK